MRRLHQEAAFLAVWLAALTVSPAFGFDESARLGLEGGAGLAFPLGSKAVRDQGSLGMGFGLGMRYGLSPRWGLGLSYEPMDLGGGIRVRPLYATAIRILLPEHRLTPVVRAGFGASSVQRLRGSYSQYTSLGLKLGAGLEYFYSRDRSVSALATYHFIPSSSQGPHQVHAAAFGLMGTCFFGPPDEDKDGVADSADACPRTPQGVKADARGCPQDEDGDGVPDHLDGCPGTPAGVGVDTAGCPLDSDADGVPDHLDACPKTPADIKAGKDGCPLDSDADGVPDHIDRCPDTPRTAVPDPRGCPYELQYEYEPGKTEVDPPLKERIRELAELMKAHPGSRVAVYGYTDTSGNEELNWWLSQKRAENVRGCLIREFGIDPARIAADSLGSAAPVSENRSPEGRARNRRIVGILRR